jgi:hypothetical protein
VGYAECCGDHLDCDPEVGSAHIIHVFQCLRKHYSSELRLNIAMIHLVDIMCCLCNIFMFCFVFSVS